MDDRYGNATDFRSYHTSRGVAVPLDADDADINSALLVGSEWLDGKYRSSFPGLKIAGRDQLREWPRTGAFDVYGYTIPHETVPSEVEHATYEAAFRHMVSPGSLSVDYTPPKYSDVSVSGAVAVKFTQFADALAIQTQFTIINHILSGILTGMGNASSLSGEAWRV